MPLKIFKTSIVGSEFRPDLTQSHIDRIKESCVCLCLEPTNDFDKHAIKCIVDGVHVGYIPKYIAMELSGLLASKDSYYSAEWRGPGAFDIEVRVNTHDSCAAINKDKYYELLVSELSDLCGHGTAEQIQLKIDFILQAGYSRWYLINQVEPVYSAAKSDNIIALEFLVEFGFKATRFLNGALKASISCVSMRCFLFLINMTPANFKYEDALIEAYKCNNESAKRHLRGFLSQPNVLIKAFEYSITACDEVLFSDILSANPKQDVLDEFFVFAAKMKSVAIFKRFCETEFHPTTIYLARCESIRNGMLQNFVLMAKYGLNTNDLADFFELAIREHEIDVASGLLQQFGTREFAFRSLKYLVNEATISIHKLGKINEQIQMFLEFPSLSDLAFDFTFNSDAGANLLRLVEILDVNALSLLTSAFFLTHKPRIASQVLSKVKRSNYADVEFYQGSYNYFLRYIRIIDLDIPAFLCEKLHNLNITNLLDFSLLPEDFARTCGIFTIVEANEISYAYDEFDVNDEKFEPLCRLASNRVLSDKALLNAVAEQIDIPVQLEAEKLQRLIMLLQHLRDASIQPSNQEQFSTFTHENVLKMLTRAGLILPSRFASLID